MYILGYLAPYSKDLHHQHLPLKQLIPLTNQLFFLKTDPLFDTFLKPLVMRKKSGDSTALEIDIIVATSSQSTHSSSSRNWALSCKSLTNLSIND